MAKDQRSNDATALAKCLLTECHAIFYKQKAPFQCRYFPIRGSLDSVQCVVKSCQCGLLDVYNSVTRSGVKRYASATWAPVSSQMDGSNVEFNGPLRRSSVAPDPYVIDVLTKMRRRIIPDMVRGREGEREQSCAYTNSTRAISVRQKYAEVALVRCLLLDL